MQYSDTDLVKALRRFMKAANLKDNNSMTSTDETHAAHEINSLIQKQVDEKVRQIWKDLQTQLPKAIKEEVAAALAKNK